MATLTWRGFDGDGVHWDDQYNWETDGMTYAVPTSGDAVIIPSGKVVTCAGTDICASLDWQGAIYISGSLNVSGNIAIASTATVTGPAGLTCGGVITDDYSKLPRYTVNGYADANGTIGGTSTQTIIAGCTYRCSIYANTGYVYSSITGTGYYSSGNLVIDNVHANQSSTVNFTVIVLTISAAASNGSVSGSNPQTVNYGGTLTFGITPTTGYILDHISPSTNASWSANTLQVTSIIADETYTVYFKVGTKLYGVNVTKLYGVACSKIHNG